MNTIEKAQYILENVDIFDMDEEDYYLLENLTKEGLEDNFLNSREIEIVSSLYEEYIGERIFEQ